MTRAVFILALTGCATPREPQLAMESAARVAIKTASSSGFTACCAESAEREQSSWNVVVQCEQRSLRVVVDDQGNVIALR
jgi:hypothetical protein